MSIFSRPTLLALAITSTLAPALSAQAPQFGLQASIMEPLGTLKTIDSRTGFALAATLDIPLDAFQSLRPRIEFTQAQSQTSIGTEIIGPYSWTTNMSAITKHYYAGADYLVKPTASKDGVYLFLGLGVCKSSVKYEGSMIRADVPNAATEYIESGTDQTRLAFASGIGYRLGRHLSLEGKVTVSDFQGITLSWVNLGASYRF